MYETNSFETLWNQFDEEVAVMKKVVNVIEKQGFNVPIRSIGTTPIMHNLPILIKDDHLENSFNELQKNFQNPKKMKNSKQSHKM